MASAPPEAIAVSLALHEAKAFLRVEHSEEDALIAGFVRSAEAACEAFTGLTLIEREGREAVAADGQWHRLRQAPVRSITGVTALPGGEAIEPGGYGIDIDAAGEGWVRVQARSGGRAEAAFTAGLAADWNGLPEPLRQGIVRLAAHLYAERGGGGDPPAAVAALWRPWRRLRLR
jgi:uncharacterized phiE125 gp8 family phage protein